MKVHVLQHVSFEGIGSIADWLKTRSAEVGYTRFFDDPILPELAGLDLILVMGGPMSVNDEVELPWLRPEKDFIRQAVEKKIPLVGICLGAQLIASALGARVYKNRAKEIGWFPIEATAREADLFPFPEKSKVFHWHGETFDLPVGAVRLAKSAACDNQAFQLGQHAIGMQFHLETTPESLRAIIDNCRSELRPAQYIQTEAQMREISRTVGSANNALLEEILSFVTRPST